ncbi:MAG: hypothetical protein HY204_03435 [Nitrospirae bacterium]|nr:hypothetical protein [Nitrospirota bacterium]
MSKKPKQPEKQDQPKKEEKKKPIHIVLPVLPSDEGTLDDEMNELFEEDKVKHKHGQTEPERD